MNDHNFTREDFIGWTITDIKWESGKVFLWLEKEKTKRTALITFDLRPIVVGERW